MIESKLGTGFLQVFFKSLGKLVGAASIAGGPKEIIISLF
jgi:hypothetical protein